MGLYIKDMEMPKKSGQYVLYLDVYGDPPAAPPDVHMADCVRYFAFEVPEPHGDLIDRQALLEGEGRYFISLCKEGIDVEEILRAKTVIPASEVAE